MVSRQSVVNHQTVSSQSLFVIRQSSQSCFTFICLLSKKSFFFVFLKNFSFSSFLIFVWHFHFRSGYNAGGSPAYVDTTSMNPQFHIQIPRSPSLSKCHVVVSVTQQYETNTGKNTNIIEQRRNVFWFKFDFVAYVQKYLDIKKQVLKISFLVQMSCGGISDSAV